jgi:hypothetical protein
MRVKAKFNIVWSSADIDVPIQKKWRRVELLLLPPK